MQHCKKHKQDYEDYLDGCPICAGERMGIENKPVRIKIGRRKMSSKSKITGVVGLDMSLTSTGYARIEAQPAGNFNHFAIKSKKDEHPSQIERIEWIAKEILGATQKTDVVFMEDYAFGARKGENSLANLGELGGVSKLLLLKYCGWHVMPVAISQWKKFLCNKGNLNKDEFKMQVLKKFQIECPTNDEAAAIAIADFGQCILRGGSTERDLTQYEKETLAKYRKAHLKQLQALAKMAKKN